MFSETIVFDTLENFADDGTLNLSTLNDTLQNSFNAGWFADQIKNWQSHVIFELDDGVESYFNDTGSSQMFGLAIFGIVLGIAIAAIGFFFGGTHSSILSCSLW